MKYLIEILNANIMKNITDCQHKHTYTTKTKPTRGDAQCKDIGQEKGLILIEYLLLRPSLLTQTQI